MACGTCDHTMQNLGLDPAGGRRTWYCPRCGSLRTECWVGDDVYVEDTVPRWTRLMVSQQPGYNDDLDKELDVVRRRLRE